MTIDDAARMRIVRAITGMNSMEFAKRLGISNATLTAWEHGRSTPQRNKRTAVTELCKSLGIAFLPSGMPVPMSDLITPVEEPQNA